MIITSARLVFSKDKSFVKAYAVKGDGGEKFRIGPTGWTPGTQAMYAFGQFGVDLIKQRVSKGVGSDDSTMPPLKNKNSGVLVLGKFVRQRTGYAARKEAKGLRGNRDLTGFGIGGHMLDSFTVRYADGQNARMEITQALARQKALSNEKRAPWFGWSPSDVVKLQAYSKAVFGSIRESILYRENRAALPPGQFASAA